MRKTLSLSEPVLGEEEKQALNNVIDSAWLTMGEKVKEFERMFADMHGLEQAVAVSSCTAGLHLNLAALGVGEGDEVLVPSLTFVSAVNSILFVGASPVFVDIESLQSPHVSMAHAREKLSQRTKAVIVMHYGGYVLDMPAWRAFADEHDLFLIEDAAHAPGVEGVGQLSDAVSYSFFSNKNMTTAEGGMVASRKAKTLDTMRSLRAHGMTSATLDRHKGHAYSYDVTMLGYNYRIDELRAAIGLVQLSKLHQWTSKRQELSNQYRSFLAERCPQMEEVFTAKKKTAAHLFPVVLPENTDRGHVMKSLREKGIQSSNHYPPAHLFSYYREKYPGVELPLTETYCARQVSLPLHASLDQSDVEYVCETLAGIL